MGQRATLKIQQPGCAKQQTLLSTSLSLQRMSPSLAKGKTRHIIRRLHLPKNCELKLEIVMLWQRKAHGLVDGAKDGAPRAKAKKFRKAKERPWVSVRARLRELSKQRCAE